MEPLVPRDSPDPKQYDEVGGSEQGAASPGESAVHNEEAYRALRYLLTGTVLGMVGGLYSTYLSLAYTGAVRRHINMEGELFRSGNAYWPPSVSNMVNDPDSPAGKVWLAMMTTSSFLTILSWYPYQLQNAWVGEAVPLLPCLPSLPQVKMALARTFLPPLGMLFVALCHTEDSNKSDPGQMATLIFHTGGAVMWIGVTLYTEVYTLAFSKVVKIHPTERKLRWAMVVLSAIAAVVFVITTSVSSATLGLCCDDEYRTITNEVIETARANKAWSIVADDKLLMERAHFDPKAAPPLYQGLYNTAYGAGLVWKRLQFWGECCAGGFMLLDLFVIWLYAVEKRTVTHADELPRLG